MIQSWRRAAQQYRLTKDIRLTDLGNARRLVRNYGRDLRYCHPMACWFVWDEKRWRCDDTAEVERRAKQTVATIYSETPAGPSKESKEEHEEERKALAAWALRSESRERINAMIALAQSEPGIPVMPADLDADSFLLNVQNGTLDLRTGVLREPRREDLITKLAPVVFDGGAHSERWDRFIARALPDPQTQRYAQRMAGRALLGRTGDDKMFLIHGPTRTGKGTFQSALDAVLGEYAVTAGLSDLAERRNRGGPQPEIVRLRGARLVQVYESSRQLKLSASLIKTLCGSDPITARDLYESQITFLPMFTLIIAANYRPKLPSEDDAVWERVV
ncbi:MAG: DNA primase family protein, partial [Myxococcota bacterium]